jgi:hypothetical protein
MGVTYTYNDEGEFFTVTSHNGHQVHIAVDGSEVQVGDNLHSLTLDQIGALACVYPLLRELVSQRIEH